MPDHYTLPSGLILTPAAAASYIARGLCTADDLVPHAAPPAAPGIPAASAAVPTDIEATTSALPINPDRFTRGQLATIAQALGLDNDGSKAALTARINGLADEVGTAAAIHAL